MTQPLGVNSLLAALDLPESARVDQRVPKKLLVENGAPTSADKRRINEGIEEVIWLAVLKPTTIGVPEYRDEVREYLEIAVLNIVLRPAADSGTKVDRLLELMHRAIPYPVVLLCSDIEGDSHISLSLAHKRCAQNDVSKVILDGDMVDVSLGDQSPMVFVEAQFLNVLALGHQPRTTLYALYQGWLEKLMALQAARTTGQFILCTNPEQAAARHSALNRCHDIDSQILRLRSSAAKEKQVSHQVEINLQIKNLQAERSVMWALL